MEKNISQVKKSDCVGCAACHDVCPKSCITMEYFGLHNYPRVNPENCIECGRCMNVCPVFDAKGFDDKEKMQKYYAAWATNKEERKSGTSGGVGTALAHYAIDNGWLVVGAAFDNHWILSHQFATRLIEIDKIKGSKYLQSDMKTVYGRIVDYLKTGAKMLFIGTPCQVEAVKKFVPNQYKDQLLTCGIICHGVNSPIVWEDYVNYIEHKYSSKLVSYNFRSKKNGWGEGKRGNKKLNVSFQLSDGKVKYEPAWNNLFHHWFGQHYILRESCFHCKFRKEQRNSDITIGDFWGLKNILPELKGIDDGVSVIITSTQKGNRIINESNTLHLIPVDGNKTSIVLKGFIERGVEEKKKEEIKRMKLFETEYIAEGFEFVRKKYPTISLYDKIKASLRYRLGF